MFRKGRLIFVSFFMILCFASLIWRLANLQIVEGAKHTKSAENIHEATIKILPERGQICDRTGTPLALNAPSYEIFWRRIGDEIEKDKLTKIHD